MTDHPSATFVIADDHAVVRRGLQLDLQQHSWLQLVGEASDGAGALELILATSPQVAFVDLRLPNLNGVAIVRRLVEEKSPTRVIIFSAFTDAVLVRRAFDAGAWGYIDKASDVSVFVDAIVAILGDERYVDPSLMGALMTATQRELSEREEEILRLMAEGLSNAQIAERLELGVESVKTYVRRILDKFDADSRTAVVAEAMRRAII